MRDVPTQETLKKRRLLQHTLAALAEQKNKDIQTQIDSTTAEAARLAPINKGKAVMAFGIAAVIGFIVFYLIIKRVK
jgi:hypothetical protein